MSDDELNSDDENGFFSKVKSIRSKLGIPPGIRTKIMYSAFLISGFFVALILRNGVFGSLNKIWPAGWEFWCDHYRSALGCSCEGGFVVYRISFSCVIFFTANLFFATRIPLCIGDKARLFIQNTWFFWIFRLIFFFILLLIPFIIPDAFFYGWGWLSLFASCLFLFCQLIVLNDFAFSWQEDWINSADTNTKVWIMVPILLVISCSFCFIGILFFGAEIAFFGIGKTCHLNRILIISVPVIGVVLLILSFIRSKGIMPGCIIFAYAQFMIWCAIMSNPDRKCYTISGWIEQDNANNVSQIITIAFSAALALFSIIKTSISTSFLDFFSCGYRPGGGGKKEGEGYDNLDDFEESKDDEDDEDPEVKAANRRENQAIVADLVVLILCSFYFGSVLNSWEIGSPQTGKDYSYGVSTTSFIIKTISVYVMYLIFGISLIAKFIFFWRDFGENDSDSDDEWTID